MCEKTDCGIEKTKTVTGEIGGEEYHRYLGRFNIEMPADVSKEEFEGLNPSFFDPVCQIDWWFQESLGIRGCDQMKVVMLSNQPTDQFPTVRLVRTGDGQLVIQEGC